ncbi:formate dehydrogenase accessory sulfurtransferase FdhD [Caldalkalibacillus mannanilyticus]|uniref:formate dehydrogenase accessory sulfurtransferase FdhD n=1 Tax=Caldalkalibacillus mannanilyticus TaxID=1418 RepID=UPI0004682B8C|nr:formate dehydrogenase accessory sulfurtransferase FdhD [Caldalkalibacillus mannanilyticus]
MKEIMSEKRSIIKYDGESLIELEENIVTEYPLTIMLNGDEFATIVCTPTHLDELVVGFLASEGMILVYSDIKSLSIDDSRGFAYVELHRLPKRSMDFHSKRFIGSCCGKSRQAFYFHNDVHTAKNIRSHMTIPPQTCLRLMASMEEQSQIFKLTGGVHNAGLCDKDTLLTARTDIGRHNALDKLYGYCLIQRVPIRDKLIVFSGRVSSEILLKVAKIGIGLILSKSAPTELALSIADELNITVVGFIRNKTCNIYTHPERIVMDE